jgi:predicted secreted Zn-dependent protease
MLPLLAALLASPAAGPLDGIPGLHILPYDVRGRDWDAIGRSIATHGMGRADGLQVAARTSWRVQWHAGTEVSGPSCRIVSAGLRYAISVTLPRLVDENRLGPALRRRWRVYLRELETHEAGHARYAYRHLGDIRKAVLASDCAHVKGNAQRAIDAINRWETRYDVLTRHGARQDRAPPIG